MNLITLTFLIFCIISLFIYFIVPKKNQWIVLLISSVIFLFWDNLHISTILQALLVLLTSYFLGIKIEKNSNTKKGREYLILGIVVIIGQLVCLKYINLFAETLTYILKIVHINYEFYNIENISLIGISYYSLIMISYLVDIYRGTCKAQKNIFKCALFMTYFPILPSGPFIRYNDMENELYTEHKFNYKNLRYGLLRILWGIFKILVISQRLGIFVDGVYDAVDTYKGFFIIVAMLFFTLQLYTNFSGSIDIIIGISEIIGIKLPENFNLPFLSKTITELWRRWHITLGAWLRDYIFYPLLKSDYMQNLNKKYKKIFGKKIGKKIPLYASMLIMWLLIGIWHGGAYTFIIGSGILQFIFMVLEDILGPISSKINKKLGIDTNTFSYKLYQIIRTYLLFSFAMIFFRAETVSKAVRTIKNIFVWNPWILLDNSSLYEPGLDLQDFSVAIISIVILFTVELLSRKINVREKFLKQNIVFRWLVFYSFIFAIIIFGCYGVGYDPAAFIYRQF